MPTLPRVTLSFVRLEELIEALRQPGNFPDAEHHGRVDVVQTHASVVFLVGDTAWKIKKPVNLGFLDFSTLEQRRDDCLAELALNRRLVPEIYRGLAAVVRDGIDRVRVTRDPPPSASVIEWVVEMRRLPAEGMLDRLIERREVRPEMLRQFAADLAAFHARADGGPAVAIHGAMAVLERRIRDNLDRLAAHATRGSEGADAPLEPDFVRRLRDGALESLHRLEPLLERRRSAGAVRDGHGDLHARNLCLVDGRIIAYDCLEFQPAYRCADVAMDVAFLAMDLDRRGQTELAETFVDAYRAASGDATMDAPCRFFKLHYAIVRAMVESIRLHEAETPAEDHASIRDDVRSYAALAAGYLVEPATVLLMGLPASGKSTFATHLRTPLRATVLSSDRLRKALHGMDPTDRGSAALYAPSASEATYAALADATRRAAGSVIVDASHRLRSQRSLSVAAAKERGGRWILVELVADEATTERRMVLRGGDPRSVSDATIDVYRRLRAEREAPTEIPAARLITMASEPRSEAESAAHSVSTAALAVLAALMGVAPIPQPSAVGHRA